MCPVFKIRSLHPTSVYLTNCLTAHNQLGSRDWLVYTTAPRTRRRACTCLSLPITRENYSERKSVLTTRLLITVDLHTPLNKHCLICIRSFESLYSHFLPPLLLGDTVFLASCIDVPKQGVEYRR